MSLALLAVVAPVVPIVFVAIKLSSPGPVLHRARRMGLGGSEFTLLKFRTMRIGMVGHAITAAGDNRVTKIGRLLRATKLDELPQLLNVLRGEMSLVGPRPEDSRYLNSYGDNHLRVLGVRPGITGAAAVAYRNEEELLSGQSDLDGYYRTVVLPTKLQIELDYLANRSFRLDLGLLVQTVLAVVR